MTLQKDSLTIKVKDSPSQFNKYFKQAVMMCALINLLQGLLVLQKRLTIQIYYTTQIYSENQS